MTKEDIAKLTHILSQPRFSHSRLLEQWRDTAEVTEETPKGTRTSAQNNSIHLWLTQVAMQLDKDGHTMQDIVKAIRRAQIRPTMAALKECVWKPYQEAALGTDSTTKLSKQDVDKVYEGLNKFFGDAPFHIHVPFPSDEGRHLQDLAGYKGDDRSHLENYYPQEEVKTAFDD